MRTLQNICVFCGASNGADPIYVAAAQALGQTLVQRGLGLVYGGGTVGLMGTVALTVEQLGGQVVGVIPQSLTVKEIVQRPVGQLILVNTMHERKAKMAQLADAFIALPGGFGTMDELFEAITWGQLGIHSKPIGLLNINNFYTPLLQWVEQAVAHGFVRPQHRKLLAVAQEPAQLIDQLRQYEAPPGLVQWKDLTA